MLIIKPANAKYSKLLSLIYQINLLQNNNSIPVTILYEKRKSIRKETEKEKNFLKFLDILFC